MLRSALSQVGGGGGNKPPSICESYFREYMAGRITFDEYQMGTAVWVAQNLETVPPKVLQPISAPLADYVRRRCENTSPRDAGLSFRLGQWLHVVNQTAHDTREDAKLLDGFLERLENAKLTKYADAIRAHLTRFTMTVPDVVGAAFRVQAMDAADKLREQRSA